MAPALLSLLPLSLSSNHHHPSTNPRTLDVPRTSDDRRRSLQMLPTTATAKKLRVSTPSASSRIIPPAVTLSSSLRAPPRTETSAKCFMWEEFDFKFAFFLRIEDKGKDYRTYMKSGKLKWFVRETEDRLRARGELLYSSMELLHNLIVTDVRCWISLFCT